MTKNQEFLDAFIESKLDQPLATQFLSKFRDISRDNEIQENQYVQLMRTEFENYLKKTENV
ncbi:MAG: hypothetical protein ACK4PR_12970 [Gammaproteobacteria bacterium]